MTPTSVGLLLGVYSSGLRLGRIVAEGRTRISVQVRFVSGRVTTRRAYLREVSIPRSTADALTVQLTAFSSFHEMVNAGGGYRPTIYPTSMAHRLLRIAYDRHQSGRNDDRRVYPPRVVGE